MKLYTIYDRWYRYSYFLKEAIRYQTPSVVDFGTAMINKRKMNRRK